MTIQDYDKIDALNYSTLKLMETSAAFARHRYNHPEEDEEKLAFLIGRAIHCATLEPERFSSAYVVEPDFAQMARDKYGNLRTKAAQKYRDDLAEEWNVKTPADAERITREIYDMALRAADAVHNHECATGYLKGAMFEHVIQWEQSGIKCKGRIDASMDRIVDLKYTRHNTLHNIERDAANYNYHAQLAWYHDGAVAAGLISGDKLPVAIFVHASQKSKFVDIAILDMEGVYGTLEYGRAKYKKLLTKYIGCRATNWWPGMAPKPVMWILPDWKLNADADDHDEFGGEE